MKISALFLIALWTLSPVASASTAQNETPATSTTQAMSLSCVTEYPTTSLFSGNDGSSSYKILWEHAFGTKYMPIYEGMITPNDLPMIQKMAVNLEKLGSSTRFQFPLKNCKKTSRLRLECFNGLTTEINGLKVKPEAFYTTVSRHDTIAGVYETVTVTMSLSINGENHRWAMEYDPKYCSAK